ncbi:MAG: BatD family protein [Prevotella sp.]|jgi:hypothetical protein|nr:MULTISPECIES: BatD family protein [unclassified Prevotella]MCH3971003.1 BatD family protein [Prevotella sp.]MCH3985617.1 BatD family protein [Prevotella sp.]MCH3993152.1 BatD family protein [Prevotella sp.]MCH4017999.1 BatD family protein [Prevotella sp.]MCH4100806.1 BatD family protein [Prevotella sp.]
MNQFIRKIVIGIVTVLCASPVWSQVQVEQKIDSMQILIGQQANLHLTVALRKGQKAYMPAFKRSQMITPGVEVLSWNDGDTTSLDNGRVQIERTYTLTSFHQKLYPIPALNVKVDGKNYHGNQLALKVLTVPVDTLHPDKFYPPKDVQSNIFEWRDWSPVFWGSMLMLLLCAFFFYCYVRLKENKPIMVHFRIIKRVPAHEKALSKIQKIKHEHVENMEGEKAYYTQLTDALREYIQNRFGFRAKEMTSSDIIERLRQAGDQEMISELTELFQTADLVKFAKYETFINENDRNLVNAIKFIDETKTNEVPAEEKVAPTLSASDQKTRDTRRNIKIALTVTGLVTIILLVYVIVQVVKLI